MAACTWYVLCLLASFGPTLATIHWECLGLNIEKCEGAHIQRVTDALGEGPDYSKMCNSIKTLIECAQIDCGGEAWDPTDDYLTKQLQFSRAIGLCGGEMQRAYSQGLCANGCAKEVGKTCLEKMAKLMNETNQACTYYGVYSQCVIEAGPACDDVTTTAFIQEMKRQLQEKMPTVFGQTTVSMCEEWPGNYLV